jgi:hypothetical protein
MADKQLVAYAQLFGLWMLLVLVVCILGTGLPPEKWSSLKYGF